MFPESGMTGDTMAAYAKKPTSRLPVALGLLLFSLRLAAGAQTFRLEPENLPRHARQIRDRPNASGGKTVHIAETSDRLALPFCLHRPLSANITVTYSNDGGSDDVRMKVPGAQRDRTFSSETGSGGGAHWNVFKTVSFTGFSLSRGYHHLSLLFEALDTYGIEIDYIGVSVDDEFINDGVFRCNLAIAAEPTFQDRGKSSVTEGYVKQESYTTPCPEEDNVHLSVYHDNIKQYKLTATDPLYRTMNDFNRANDAPCSNLEPLYWKFRDVDSTTESPVTFNKNNATLNVEHLENDVSYKVKYTVSFTLKGFKTGFIDADKDSNINVNLRAASTSTVKVTYQGKSKTEETLKEVKLEPGPFKIAKLNIKELSWSEDFLNYINIYVSDENTALDKVTLSRGDFTPDKYLELYASDTLVLQGVQSSFWWRRPVNENLTVRVGDNVYSNLAQLRVYVPSPWNGPSSVQQIFVLYQDGNARLLPLPPNAPNGVYSIPFGTSVIVGKSNPKHLRPAASIKTLVFDPETMEMTLTYYDGSTSKLVLSYTNLETSVTVKDMRFDPSTAGLPFATFRSMFVEFGNTDSDALQSDEAGPVHVLGNWTKQPGREFLLYRMVESFHLTKSPDIRLVIEEVNA